MKQEGIYDLALVKIQDIIGLVSDNIAEKFSKVKPFDQKEVPTSEIFDAYENFSLYDLEAPMVMQSFIDKYGADEVEKFISEMEAYRQKYRQGVQ